MNSPEDVDNSDGPPRFFGTRLILATIIVLAAGVTFGLWFFFISDSNNAAENSDIYLPPNCYSVNGKQACPPKS